jgi:hypothetical protein
MNVVIGTEASQFPEKEYINGISFQCRVYLGGDGGGGLGLLVLQLPSFTLNNLDKREIF